MLNKKRLLALLMALALCLTLAAPALAAEAADEPVFEAEEEPADPAAEEPFDPEAENDAEEPGDAPDEPVTPEEPAADEPTEDDTKPDLLPIVHALQYLVALKTEDPATEDIRAIGGRLAQAVLALLQAKLDEDPQHTPEPTPAPEHTLIAVVPDSYTVQDGAFNEAAYNAVTAWADVHDGYTTAAYPLTKEEADAQESSTLPALKRACAAGADIVICVGFSHAGSVEAASGEYPDVLFLWLDNSMEDAAPANVASVTFGAEESGYAAGYAAVKEGYTKLGFIGGMPNEDVDLYGYGYVQGARDAAAELDTVVTMRYDYCNVFWPDPAAYDMADGWYKAGTEVIFAAAGGANMSVGQATDANGAKSIGVDVAPGEDFPSMLTSALKDVGTAACLLLDKIAEGRWSDVSGKTTRLTAADGLDLLPTGAWLFQAFTTDDYRALLDSLQNGSRKIDANVPDDITTMANDHLVFEIGEPTAADLVSDAFIDPVSDWDLYDGLIGAIRSETDTAKRAEMLHEAEDILMATGCIVPLYYYARDEYGTYYAEFNAKSSLFDGKTPEEAACMRRAITLLIDRAAICKLATNEAAPAPAGALVPAGMPDGNGGVFRTDENNYYDPLGMIHDSDAVTAEAVTLLKAAGFKFGEDGKLSDETPLAFEYKTNPGRHEDFAAAIAADLAKVGITMTVTPVEWEDADENPIFEVQIKNGEFDLARWGWIADYDDPLAMLEIYTSDSEKNHCQFGQADKEP